MRPFAPARSGLTPAEVAALGDDRRGRALDRRFDADRAALWTAVVGAVGQRFGVRFTELHHETPTIRFCGQYRAARGRRLRGRRAPGITDGHSQDHRPALQQVLVALTTRANGGVPVPFRCADGPPNDSQTPIEPWEALRPGAGRADFRSVADSKLCTRETMDPLDRQRGRVVPGLPRARREDREFRTGVQTHDPPGELVWDRPNPRRKGGPRDRWDACRAPLPSREAWPGIWVGSPLLALRQEQSRRERLAAVLEALGELRPRLASPRTRLRTAREVDRRVEQILAHHQGGRYLHVRRTEREEQRFRQWRRGRPGPQTASRKLTRRRWAVEWTRDEARRASDRQSDGRYPRLTHDCTLTPAQVLEAPKGQPTIEKRFEQVKTVPAIAPVFLKNEGRLEALCTLYCLGLLVPAGIGRELRLAMTRQRIPELPLYPEHRRCKRPTTEQVLRLFRLVERHVLLADGQPVQVFDVELTDLPRQVLALLGVPEHAFRPPL